MIDDGIPLPLPLPPTANPAVEVVRRLHDAGHLALLAGGCVRDLLRGTDPSDFDVATDATPDQVAGLFRKTRLVGAQFGVVLVRKRGQWVEVATFRTDVDYHDGRRPTAVRFTNPVEDAQRRDFTVNGMFYDPLNEQVYDFVDGRKDLNLRRIRAIGAPARRFAEDHLRLLRAVRFAARLDYEIESSTFNAIRAHASRLALVATERVREELAKMLSHPNRGIAFRLLRETRLLQQLWPGAAWRDEELDQIEVRINRLPAVTRWTLPLAMLLTDAGPAAVQRITRHLSCSNDEQASVQQLLLHRDDLLDPDAPSLAELRRLRAMAVFELLDQWTRVRFAELPDGEQRRRRLDERLSTLDLQTLLPPPLVTGQDLIDRNVPAGPEYKRILDELYDRQLNEELKTREQGLTELEQMLARD